MRFLKLGPLVNRAYLLPSHIAWAVIIPTSILSIVPFFMGASQPGSIQSYGTIGAIPVVVAAFLRASKGSFTVVMIIQLSIAARLCEVYGIFWSPSIAFEWILSSGMGFFLAALLGHFIYLNHRLQEAITKLAQLAAIDPLTGLPNHHTLAQVLDEAVLLAKQTEVSCSIIFFDIDHFKSINDQHSHTTGDVVLQGIASQIQSNLPDAAIAGRWGGEEFIVLLPQQQTESAALVAERLRLAVSQHPVAVGNMHLACTISSGVATYPYDAPSLNDLIEAADQAMLYAKRHGRNRICLARDLKQTTIFESEEGSREEIAIQGVVQALWETLAAHDAATGIHCQRVALLTKQIAQVLQVEKHELRTLEMVGLLHDLGKVAILPAVLNKTSPLTEGEWHVLQTHPLRGAEIIKHIPALRSLYAMIRAHHERWDGKGYPDGLSGEDIPVGARIIAVADSYDTMCATRSYKPSSTHAQALQEMRRCSGSQFDPGIVAALEQAILPHEQQQKAA